MLGIMLGVETRKNGFTDACMAVFDADDVRYSDRRHFFFISRPLLLNTRLLLTSVRNKKTIIGLTSRSSMLCMLLTVSDYKDLLPSSTLNNIHPALHAFQSSKRKTVQTECSLLRELRPNGVELVRTMLRRSLFCRNWKKNIKWVSQTEYKLLFLFFLDCDARP